MSRITLVKGLLNKETLQKSNSKILKSYYTLPHQKKKNCTTEAGYSKFQDYLENFAYHIWNRLCQSR